MNCGIARFIYITLNSKYDYCVTHGSVAEKLAAHVLTELIWIYVDRLLYTAP
jgi:hypothetical protein